MRVRCATGSSTCTRALPVRRSLQPDLLQRWERVDRQIVDGVYCHPRSYAHERTEVKDWGIHHALHREVLNAMQEGFAFGFVTFAGLLLEEGVNVRIAPVGV